MTAMKKTLKELKNQKILSLAGLVESCNDASHGHQSPALI
jgi:hypothetical protein